ncbi:MAG TPA: MgtC/SapB family protein [Candidatus Pacearchaeota archaeon]|nr:MgtC/SapB family protein [Candidatus Pacearchaeota archaeon]
MVIVTPNIEILLRLVVSTLLGSAIGYERKSKHHGIGLRTASLISLTACLFTIAGTYNFDATNIARVVQGLAAGVGFIGAALIWKHKEKTVRGLTTAVSVWFLTAVGIAVGIGNYFVAILSTVIALIVLVLKRVGVE